MLSYRDQISFNSKRVEEIEREIEGCRIDYQLRQDWLTGRISAYQARSEWMRIFKNKHICPVMGYYSFPIIHGVKCRYCNR